MNNKIKIAITCGDCNGIGIEVMFKALLNLTKIYKIEEKADITIIGNLNTLIEYARLINFPIYSLSNENEICLKAPQNPEEGREELILQMENCNNYSPVNFGLETKEAGLLAKEAIERAVTGVKSGRYDAIVTMPITKNSIYLAGWKFPGHTEMLAANCNNSNPLMILCTKRIRVALATIHVSIKNVPNKITQDGLIELIEIFSNSLKQDFNIKKPRIAVLGLNPHAGENGSFGTEEGEIILPAIQKAKNENMIVEGPFPSDGFFAHGSYKQYDGILAMYHDQGLIPLKLLAKGGGVNFTAGIPIVRTSPDHGSAYEIAGKNCSNPQSSIDAILMAIDIVKFRKKNILEIL